MIKVAICTIFTLCSAASAQLTTKTFGTGENQFSIEFVAIGNPGNQADTTRPSGIGSVNYNYNIAKTEVSRGMLEKANALANLGIYYRDWGNVIRNDPDRAAVDMNWYMAASFVNYLNISTGNQAAYKFTSSGFQLWSESDPGYNPNNRFRNSLAKYVLPSRDEWYKAAYGSPNGAWYKYSNGSNTEPESVYEGTSGIVYGKLDQWGGPWQTLAKVYEAGALSPFGTMGQGGNAMEWTESEADGVNSSTQNMDANREVLGGGIGNNADGISSTALSTPYPDYGYSFGFRVAMLPDPPAVSFPYSNLLNNPNTVAQDFYDYSQLLSEMMNYDSGNFSVSNNRLEFTTASSWVGVKTLKTQLGFSSGWSAEVDFHLSPLNNVINGHWYDMGISVSMGDDLFSAFPNRINLKAVQSGEGRKIAASFYSDNVERRGFDNTAAFTMATDGTLRMVYNPINKTINCLVKPSGDPVFTSLGTIDLDQSPGWSVSPYSSINISLFAGSEPFQTVPSFPTIQSGDMYLTNFRVIPGEWIYTVANNQATITEYVGIGGAVTIPSHLNEIPVVRIGSGAFINCVTLTDVILPNTVLNIGDNAFYGCVNLATVQLPDTASLSGSGIFAFCSKLESVNLPLNLMEIPQYLFYKCSKLSSINIPIKTTTIGKWAFASCTSLTSVNFPKNISLIDLGAFDNCGNLLEFNADSENSNFSTLNGVLYNKDHTTLILFPRGKTGAYTIPNSVTDIGYNAFVTSTKITDITFGSNVKKIADGAFAWCSGLAKVLVSSGLTHIGADAFHDCVALKDIILPSSLQEIGSNAFMGCSGLEEISMPLKLIGAYSTYGINGSVSFCKTISELSSEENSIQSDSVASAISTILNTPNQYNLYTTSQIQNMAMGGVVLTKQVNGQFVLNYDIQQSTDLQNWTTYQAYALPLTGLPTDKAFVRVKMINSSPNPSPSTAAGSNMN